MKLVYGCLRGLSRVSEKDFCKHWVAGRARLRKKQTMLILSRRSGESIHLGDDIVISILGIKGKQVKVGIDVPDEIPVYREEVFRKIQQENEMAIRLNARDLVAAANIWTRESRKK